MNHDEQDPPTTWLEYFVFAFLVGLFFLGGWGFEVLVERWLG